MLRKSFKRVIMLTCALTLVGIGAGRAHNSYTFKVHNKTDQKIVKLLASPDGKTYGNFDIGSGISPGKTVTMEWSESTDDGNCEWYFKAKLADGEETDPVEFDFCEKDLVLEIE
jgi:hypothetical protein